MPYDADLAERLRDLLADREDLDERTMFGGRAFLLAGNLAVCASSDGGLLVRVAAEDQAGLCGAPTVTPMAMGARTSKTWVRVDAGALVSDDALTTWVTRGTTIASTLPPKR